MGLKTMVTALLRKPPAPETKGTRAPAPKPMFPAVSIKPGRPACEAALAAAAKRTLVREASKLPLAGCTLHEQCACSFVKHTDRREDDERRVFGWDGTTDWYGDNNRRRSRGRREDDI